MAFHVFDGNDWYECGTMHGAEMIAEDAIEDAAAVFEASGIWPNWIDTIQVYEAPQDDPEPWEGKLRAFTQEKRFLSGDLPYTYYDLDYV